MAKGKFDFRNIVKVSEEEKAELRALVPVWLDLDYPIYRNHSGEWYAAKMPAICGKGHFYRVVSLPTLREEGWKTEGFATTLKGVREVVGILAKEHDARKAAAGLWF